MARIEKLLSKAINNPKNLRFSEFCILIEHFGLVLRNSKGSHRMYKRMTDPQFTISVQEVDGKAKPYQVRSFLDKLIELGLFEDGQA